MNREPYGIPPRWWKPKLSPGWIYLSRGFRRRNLRRYQGISDIEFSGQEHVLDSVAGGDGVLIAANHSAHYDAPVLYSTVDQFRQPIYMMTAWQVFATTPFWYSFLMQRLGCFSVDRESTDRKAFAEAVQILRHRPHPLVIFPEGDIYHVTDHVTAFREGAAAMALAAAKRSERRIVCVPCGIKFWYLSDPTPNLERLMTRLEQHLFLQPEGNATLARRIYRFAEAVLALKEIDYLGSTRSGTVRERINFLTGALLARLEESHRIVADQSDGVPERVKRLRQTIIPQIHRAQRKDQSRSSLQQEMDDLFFVIQLYSYPSNYISETSPIERIAETLDKFEEDVFAAEYPSIHGKRRVTIRFGEPILVNPQGGGRADVTSLTADIQAAVQTQLDSINASSTSIGRSTM